MNTNTHHWGIVLAGGDGARLQPHIRMAFGFEKPKQYCAIVGTRSMLKHTLDRAQLSVDPERILTIVNRHHAVYASGEFDTLPRQNLITQPFNRETAPAILLAAFRAYSADPDAVVVFLPSDHFILEEQRFMDHVEAAFEFSSSHTTTVSLLGVSPHFPETDYGWIEPYGPLDEIGDSRFYSVRQFWEKPDADMLPFLYGSNYLWNTMVMVGHVNAFLEMYINHVPWLYRAFAGVQNEIGTHLEEEVIEHLYAPLPRVNFSVQILTKNASQLAVVPVQDVYWNDWGTFDRIHLDVHRFGLRSAFAEAVPLNTVA